ncbi:MAG: hypothetical protein KDK38_08475, partial [Leptospiraceae bacterium]|nr:hypothetical protein [Leptospiraceae bacterium]
MKCIYAFMMTIGFLFCLQSAHAQQNLFNIPSGEITREGKFFYQHQLNIYNRFLESKSHLVYGLGSGWDAGLNFVGTGLVYPPNFEFIHNDDSSKGALYPYLTPTIQKQFFITDFFDFNMGSQAGFNLTDRGKDSRFGFFNYAVGVFYFFDKKSRIVAGAYHTNNQYAGPGNNFGIVAGYELKITDYFYLMGDWISGNNESSSAILGGMINVTNRLQLCAGWLQPNPGS